MSLRCYYFTKKNVLFVRFLFVTAVLILLMYICLEKKHNTFIYRFAVNAFQGDTNDDDDRPKDRHAHTRGHLQPVRGCQGNIMAA